MRWLVLVAVLLCGCTAAPQEDLAEYLGPQPGKAYAYADGDGHIVHEARAVASDGHSVTVEETTYFPEPLEWEGEVISESTRQFRYRVSGNELLMESLAGEDATTLLKLGPMGMSWTNPAQVGFISYTEGEEPGPMEWRTLQSRCSLAPSGAMHILGKQRRVLTAVCRLELDEGATVHRVTFAKGIGLVLAEMGITGDPPEPMLSLVETRDADQP